MSLSLQNWFLGYVGMKRTAKTGFGASEQWKDVGGAASKYAKSLELKRSKLLDDINRCNKLSNFTSSDVENLVAKMKEFEVLIKFCLDGNKIERSGVAIYWESLSHQSYPEAWQKFLFFQPVHKYYASFDLSFDLYNMLLTVMLCLMRMTIRLLMNINHPLPVKSQVSSSYAFTETSNQQSNPPPEASGLNNALKLAKETLETCKTIANRCKTLLEINDIDYFEEDEMKKIIKAKEEELKQEEKAKKEKEMSKKKEKEKNKNKDKNEETNDKTNEIKDDYESNPNVSADSSYLPKSYKAKPKKTSKKSFSFENDMDPMFLNFILEILRSLSQELVFLKVYAGPVGQYTDYLKYSVAKFTSESFERSTGYISLGNNSDGSTIKMIEMNAKFQELFFSAAQNLFSSEFYINLAKTIETKAAREQRVLRQDESDLTQKYRGYSRNFSRLADEKINMLFKSPYGTLLEKYRLQVLPCGLFNRIISDIQTNVRESNSMGMVHRIDMNSQLSAPFPTIDNADVQNAGFVGSMIQQDWNCDGASVNIDPDTVNKVDKKALMASFQGKGVSIEFKV